MNHDFFFVIFILGLLQKENTHSGLIHVNQLIGLDSIFSLYIAQERALAIIIVRTNGQINKIAGLQFQNIILKFMLF